MYNQPNYQRICLIKIMQKQFPVNGFYYVRNMITKQQQAQLIANINKSQWNTNLKRRTQHYGYQYSYINKNSIIKTQPIPNWVQEIKRQIQLKVSQICETKVYFDQMIVNQYQAGQGISPHIDNENIFQDIVVSLSLGSRCMLFLQKKLKQEELIKQIQLERRSLFILSQQARYQWKHSIPARKKDDGVMRGTRLSITFRKMKQMIK